MADFYEIDFLDVGTKRSGDAIPLRYQVNGVTYVHLVDGGFQETGEKIVSHINKYYGAASTLDHVVVTHGDADHVGGLSSALDSFKVGKLWMLRPWLYSEELLPRFARFSSADALTKRLREAYSNLVTLEKLALDKGIAICEPLQGAKIGAFTVLAPSKARYLDLVVESDKTPQPAADDQRNLTEFAKSVLGKLAEKAVSFVKALWGDESFPEEGTAQDNEMSVVQFARLCGRSILLTGDAGRGGLKEAIDFAATIGVKMPGVDRLQVPHHGSRRNLSTELLDQLLGARLSTMPPEGTGSIQAVVSAAVEDEDHPRKTVIRALVHRGARAYVTKGNALSMFEGAASRAGWSSAKPMSYPDEQEQ